MAVADGLSGILTGHLIDVVPCSCTAHDILDGLLLVGLQLVDGLVFRDLIDVGAGSTGHLVVALGVVVVGARAVYCQAVATLRADFVSRSV